MEAGLASQGIWSLWGWPTIGRHEQRPETGATHLHLLWQANGWESFWGSVSAGGSWGGQAKDKTWPRTQLLTSETSQVQMLNILGTFYLLKIPSACCVRKCSTWVGICCLGGLVLLYTHPLNAWCLNSKGHINWIHFSLTPDLRRRNCFEIKELNFCFLILWDS